jgi:hypothetical protein
MTNAPLALRVLGGAANRRVIVSYRKAHLAYAHADPAVQPELPAFLSAFSFPHDIRDHVGTTGSSRNYIGPVGVPYIHIDIDRSDLDLAVRDARRLAAQAAERYSVDPLVHFSGHKGFHISVPTGGFVPPSPGAHIVAKDLACRLADEAHVNIDSGIYDRVRLWRAANSFHRRGVLQDPNRPRRPVVHDPDPDLRAGPRAHPL